MKIVILILFILSIGFNVYSLFAIHQDPVDDDKILRQKYPFLATRILQEFNSDILINFLDLRTRLRSQVEPYKDTYAFYFEYLPTGTSVGVNEKAEFPAASLLKVPVVMAYRHQVERTGEDPDREVSIRSDEIDKTFGTLYKSGAGAKIKLSEAERLALVESDNTAARVLTDNVSVDDFSEIYEGLDISLKEGDSGVILTAKSYASILKSLYFAGLLSKDNSQYILDLLDKSIFNDKLPAGVPSRVNVAHKIGVLGDDLFMDCGIVYVPNRPYLLCMISVSSEDVARERMVKMSKTVYDFVSSRK